MKSKVKRKFAPGKKDLRPSARLLFRYRKTGNSDLYAEPLPNEPSAYGDKRGCLVICNDLVSLQQAYTSFNETNVSIMYADHAYGESAASSGTELPGQAEAEPVVSPRLIPAPLIISNGHRQIWAVN